MECRNQAARVELIGLSERRLEVSKWVYLEVPVRSRFIEVEKNFLVVEAELLEGDLEG